MNVQRQPNYGFRSFLLTLKNKTTALLVCCVTSVIATGDVSALDDGKHEWRIYSQESNGNVHFFDASRVEQVDHFQRVWSRIQYKTSVMGASSFQNLLEIDCMNRSARVLQSTFFSDKQWEKPAMRTNKKAKPSRPIAKDSATWRLSEMVCDQ